jgi:hypothetical protein
MAVYERDSYVWISDPEECAVPGRVKENFRAGEPGKVLTEDGEVSHP